MSIIAETMKLLGNSVYGGTIMNKEKHMKIKYVKGEKKAALNHRDIEQTTGIATLCAMKMARQQNLMRISNGSLQAMEVFLLRHGCCTLVHFPL